MNFKFAKNGTVIIAKIIKMTVLSQKRYCSLQRTGHVSQPYGSVYSKASDSWLVCRTIKRIWSI